MHPWIKGIQVCSNVGSRPFPRRDNREIAKIHCHTCNLIFFSRTARPISTKLSTMHPLVKGTQICSNEGPCPFPKGDHYEKAKMTIIQNPLL